MVDILLGGWADLEKNIEPLRNFLQTHSKSFHYFRYTYKQPLWSWGPFAHIPELVKRFYTFLQDSQIFELKEYPLNIIGYSQGGMIALYAASQYPELLSKIGKMIFIATPHNGALPKDIRNSIIKGYNFVKGKISNSFLGAISNSIIDLVVEQFDLMNIAVDDSFFLSKQYPSAFEQIIKVIPKNRLLEIYSPDDYIAPPTSCRRFEAHMELFPVPNLGHYSILKSPAVMEKIISFLNT